METTALDDDALRQYIDAVTCFTAWELAMEKAARHSGGMVWKRVKGRDYLVKTSRKGRQTSLGVRSVATEQMYEAFFPAKQEAKLRLSSLRQMLERHVRVNRALKVGRVPKALIELLSASREVAGEGMVVVGDAGLYAYEAVCGVRLPPAVLQLRGTRLPAQGRMHIVLAINEAAASEGALALLQRMDSSFDIVDSQYRTVMNDAGVAADVLIAREPDRGAQAFWSETYRDLNWLSNAPRFSEVVVGSNGRMTRMTTVDPRALVLHKDWLLSRGHGLATAQDIAVAQAVERLVVQHLPQLGFEALQGSPLGRKTG